MKLLTWQRNGLEMERKEWKLGWISNTGGFRGTKKNRAVVKGKMAGATVKVG